MELLQLKYFYESAKLENFAKVAERYMVPATSVSASVRRLEKELGCELFDRQCNKISLNENGRKFKKHIGEILEKLENAVLEIQIKEEQQTEIRLLVRSMRGEIAKLIIGYQKQNPSTAFKMDVDTKTADYEEYDLIIDELDEKYSDYEKLELCSVKLRLKASSQNPLCGQMLTLSQLKNQRFVTFGAESNMHKTLVRACKNAGFIPKIAIEINDNVCHKICIENNIGIAITRQTVDTEKVKILQVVDFDERQTVYIYYKGQSLNAQLKDFMNYLKLKL